MDRIHTGSFMASDRPMLSQIAIATVLVGSAAALSSAGIAVPVGQVGFDDWDAAKAAPSKVAAEQRSSARTAPAFPAPQLSQTIASVRPAEMIAPGQRIAFARTESPERSTTAVVPSRLVLASATRLASLPSAPDIVAPPAAARATPFVAPPVPALMPVEAPASFAATAALPLPETAAPRVEQQLVEVPAATPGPLAAQAPSAAPLRLIDTPELRGFDLARTIAPRRAAPAGFAKPGARPGAAAKTDIIGTKDKLVGDAVYHQVTLSIAGSDGKAVSVRIGADMKPSLKVGDLLTLVSDRMDPDNAARFAAAASAEEYVSLATLRAAGFTVDYSAGTDTISIDVGQ
jgi:hypothetical protein